MTADMIRLSSIIERLCIAMSSKMVKYEKTCSDNQHAFIPFAFDTFGFLAPEVVDLLHRVQKVMHIAMSCLLGP